MAMPTSSAMHVGGDRRCHPLLVPSQRLLGTREIILLHHTDCRMQRVIGDTLKDEIESETGLRPAWAFESFKDHALVAAVPRLTS